MKIKILKEINVTREEAAYAAGFFDGEGCINFAISRYRRNGELRGKTISLRVMIGNTDLDILYWFLDKFGGHLQNRPRPSNKNAKPQGCWSLTYREAIPFLRVVEPYVRVKKAQLVLALEFASWRDTPIQQRCYKLPPAEGTWRRTQETVDKEAEFKQRLHELNRKGMSAYITSALPMN